MDITVNDTGEYRIGNIHIYNAEIDSEDGKMTNYYYAGNQAEIGELENVSFINPIKLSGFERQAIFIQASDNAIVEDKHNQLVYDMGDVSFTFGVGQYRKTITNESNVSTKNIDLNDYYYPDFDVVLVAPYGVRIRPDANSIIYPLASSSGQPIYADEVGARITLRRVNSTTWHIVNMIGNWQSEA